MLILVLFFFCFLRPDLSPWGYSNRCFLVALCCLIARRSNLEVVSKRLLHQHVKIPGEFQCHAAHGSVSLLLYLVVWIFLQFLGVICYDKWVSSEGYKIYFKDWYLMNSQPTSLILTSFNSMKLPYYQKDKNQKIWITQLFGA